MLRGFRQGFQETNVLLLYVKRLANHSARFCAHQTLLSPFRFSKVYVTLLFQLILIVMLLTECLKVRECIANDRFEVNTFEFLICFANDVHI